MSVASSGSATETTLSRSLEHAFVGTRSSAMPSGRQNEAISQPPARQLGLASFQNRKRARLAKRMNSSRHANQAGRVFLIQQLGQYLGNA